MTILIGVAANAQVKNVGLGGNFMGTSTITINGLEDHGALYVNTYRPILGGSIYYESVYWGMTHLLEASYMMGELESVKQGEYYLEGWNPASFSPAKIFQIYHYSGHTFLSGHRLQIPVYLGIGLNYNMADPVKCFTYNLAAKARVKFYLTDKIGLYGGAGWKGGLGTQHLENGESRGVTQSIVYLEGGITFCLE